MLLDDLSIPIIQAPMAGGPSTPELALAVNEAGALGFLAGGYLDAEIMRSQIRALRERTARPFGVNLFVPDVDEVDAEALGIYVERLQAEAARYDVELGELRFSDDGWEDKLRIVAEERPAVVSFTFGCPSPDIVSSLRARQIEVWVTVTRVGEAREATHAGADALVVQGAEAGGHRGSFVDSDEEPSGLMALLRLIAAECDLPLVATGGIGDGAGVAAALAAGATAAQLGTAFMLAPEAGTRPAHRRAIAGDTPTGLTRAFTGRQARGIVNRFQAEHSADAPSAYPHVHYLTSPVRAAARERDDPDGFNLWAGQAHQLARAQPAGEIVRELWSETRRAASSTAQRAGHAFKRPRIDG